MNLCKQIQMSIYQTILNVVTVIGLVAMAAALVLELRYDLMMLQQNSYRPERYRRWLSKSGDTTSFPKLFSYIIVLVWPNAFGSHILPVVEVLAILLLGIVTSRKMAVAKYKKPLAWTARVKRLFTVQILLSALISAALILYCADSLESLFYVAAVAMVACYAISHIITLAALWLLKPVEAHINRKFYNAAKRKLQSMPGLRIVGITGSYGKTSTKHYLHRILSERYDTLMTPGSYNTTLGVVRTVNEYLKPYNEVFIVEMGAKQPGDIKEICDLVHPGFGIITAVGPQHLETFHTIEKVRDTKFELADALPADGVAVVNNDFPMIAGRAVDNTRCLRYGITHPEGCDYTARNICYTPQGTTFEVVGKGVNMQLSTQLLGECNISDLLAAIVMAIELGVPHEKIKFAVARIEPVEHRLSRKRLATGLTIIDDAFNSNPGGSRMALDVLAMMTGGRRFVITPGMIELGDEQEELNRQLGEHAAACCDTAIVVGQYNAEAITQGLRDGGMAEADIRRFPTFNQAFAWVMANHSSGDTVLIENDLPDTFK